MAYMKITERFQVRDGEMLKISTSNNGFRKQLRWFYFKLIHSA